MERVCIIGTGQIGTSLGLAIKAVDNNVRIKGFDANNDNASRAKKRGAIDSAEWNLPNAVAEAEMVIVAIPVGAMREVFENIAPRLAQGAVVTDTGSTKQAVIGWADEFLPQSASFVGGNPMAGKELSGPDAGDMALFQNKHYCIIPSRRARPEAVSVVVDMVTKIGAKPYFIGPDEHDSYVAAVSHLPMLLSVALVGVTAKSPSWADIQQLASSGYRDVTSPASGDPIAHRDICLTNLDGIKFWIDNFIEELKETKRILSEGGSKGIQEMFNKAWELREKWLAGIPPRQQSGPEIGSFGERVGELFIGRALMDRQKKLFDKMKKEKKDQK